MESVSQDDNEPKCVNDTPRKKMFCKGEARAGIPQRKVRYRLYPNATQEAELQAHLALHCRLYNTALADRIQTYTETGKGLSFADQTKHLTQWRKDSHTLAVLNAQSEQVTLRRVELAFQSFFRRVKEGAEAVGSPSANANANAKPCGFPRFKPLSRCKGWGYKD